MFPFFSPLLDSYNMNEPIFFIALTSPPNPDLITFNPPLGILSMHYTSKKEFKTQSMKSLTISHILFLKLLMLIQTNSSPHLKVPSQNHSVRLNQHYHLLLGQNYRDSVLAVKPRIFMFLPSYPRLPIYYTYYFNQNIPYQVDLGQSVLLLEVGLITGGVLLKVMISLLIMAFLLMLLP